MSAVSRMSFTPTVMPCSSPCGATRAWRRASSGSRKAHACTSPSRAAMRARQSSTASAKLLQFLHRAHAPGDLLVREQARELGVAHFAHVDVTARIDREAVRRDELARLEAGAGLAAEARD